MKKPVEESFKPLGESVKQKCSCTNPADFIKTQIVLLHDMLILFAYCLINLGRVENQSVVPADTCVSSAYPSICVQSVRDRTHA